MHHAPQKPATAKKSRRWRYSLRTLLVLITIACAGLAWAHMAQRQRAMVGLLLKSNPSAEVSYVRESDERWPAWLEHLMGVDSLASVTSVGLMYPTDIDFELLTNLPQVRTLVCNRSIDLTDAGLKHLTSLSRLESLTLLDAEQIDDAGLEILASLPQLKRLHLGVGRRVTRAGLERLKARGFGELKVYDGDGTVSVDDLL